MRSISLRELRVLDAISAHPNSTATETADRLSISRRWARRVLHELEEQALVKRGYREGKSPAGVILTYTVTTAAEIHGGRPDRSAYSVLGRALESQPLLQQAMLSWRQQC